jgi:hypothetical protein
VHNVTHSTKKYTAAIAQIITVMIAYFSNEMTGMEDTEACSFINLKQGLEKFSQNKKAVHLKK